MSSLHAEACISPAAADACPYSEMKTSICSASLSAMVITPAGRQSYCSTDNHDNCPVFLAKALRRQ